MQFVGISKCHKIIPMLLINFPYKPHFTLYLVMYFTVHIFFNKLFALFVRFKMFSQFTVYYFFPFAFCFVYVALIQLFKQFFPFVVRFMCSCQFTLCFRVGSDSDIITSVEIDFCFGDVHITPPSCVVDYDAAFAILRTRVDVLPFRRIFELPATIPARDSLSRNRVCPSCSFF